MSVFELGVLGLYFLTLVILAILGFHRYVMVWLYFRHKDKKPLPRPLPERLPRVTIQLPIFNEMYVVDRLLASVAAIRYPKDLMQIQVLEGQRGEPRGGLLGRELAPLDAVQQRFERFGIH